MPYEQTLSHVLERHSSFVDRSLFLASLTCVSSVVQDYFVIHGNVNTLMAEHY